jgi:hypothetical protein
MANKPRAKRSEAETLRLAAALRANLAKRKSLAKLQKAAGKPKKD